MSQTSLWSMPSSAFLPTEARLVALSAPHGRRKPRPHYQRTWRSCASVQIARTAGVEFRAPRPLPLDLPALSLCASLRRAHECWRWVRPDGRPLACRSARRAASTLGTSTRMPSVAKPQVGDSSGARTCPARPEFGRREQSRRDAFLKAGDNPRGAGTWLSSGQLTTLPEPLQGAFAGDAHAGFLGPTLIGRNTD